MKLHDFDPETLRMAVDEMRKAFNEAGETIQRTAESFKKAFNEAGKHLIDMIDEASRRQMKNTENNPDQKPIYIWRRRAAGDFDG